MLTHDELDIHDYKIVRYLSNDWGFDFEGWTLNVSESDFAIFMRVPDKYFFKNKLVEATPEQKFFNSIRFPLKELEMTVTMYLKKVGAQVWEKHLNFFEDNTQKIKESLSGFPRYFNLLNQVSVGHLDPNDLIKIDDKVFEIWK